LWVACRPAARAASIFDHPARSNAAQADGRRPGAGPLPHPSGRLSWGSFIAAIDPAAFTDLAACKAAVSAYLARIKASRMAPGFQEILIPGERSFRTRRDQRASGVRVTDEMWPQVARLARGLGVDPDEYLAS
jgi:LDH2 family malate/lactate/ureidoglycolate dehydrogenase